MSAGAAVLAKSSWAILDGGEDAISRDAGDIVPPSTVITNVHDVFMQELELGETMLAGATSFGKAFDDANAAHVYTRALFQMQLHALETERAKYAEKAAASTRAHSETSVGEPFEVFIETVAGSVIDPDFGPVREEPVRATSFLADVPENVPIVAYRLWMFVRDPAYDLSDTIFQKIYAASKRANSYGNPAAAAGAPEKRTGEINMSAYTGDEPTTFAQTLSEFEKWQLLNSRGAWCRAIDALYGFKRLERVRARVLDEKTANKDNPAAARYTLSPYMYCNAPLATAAVEQRDMRAYMATEDGRSWHFPCSSRVVRVQPEYQSVAGLSRKMTPDYQARCVGVSAVQNALARLTRTRQRQARKRARARLGHGADVVSVRTSVLREPEPGALGALDEALSPDVLAAFAASTGVRARARMVEDDDDDGGEFVPGAAAAAAGAPALPPPPAVGAPPAPGGASRAAIEAVIASVPFFDETGSVEPTDFTSLARNEYEGTEALLAASLLGVSDDPSRSPFHLVRYTGARLYSEMLDFAATKPGRPALRERYLHSQRRMLTDLRDKCLRPSAELSKPTQRLNAWYEARAEDGRAWLGHEEPHLDAELSAFGNIFARRMSRLESMKLVTFSHLIIMTLLFGTLDAYRHAFDLHFNAVLTGENSAGKSFVCEVIRELRVPGTVEKLDEQTARADFVDTDANDAIRYTEELKLDQFRDSKSGGSDNAEASFKEKLTSQMRTMDAFCLLPNGKRHSRLVHSERITCYLGLSNVSYKEFTSAMRSRVSCYNFLEQHRPDCSTVEMASAKKELLATKGEEVRAFEDEMRVEQYMHNVIEKAIAVRAIKDVTLTSTETLVQLVVRYLNEQHGIGVTVRTVERVSMLVRKFVMSTRVEQLYSSPASPYFKKPFDILQLRDLDAMLYDTYEMASVGFELLRHEIIDADRAIVLEVLYRTAIEPALAKQVADRARNVGNAAGLAETRTNTCALYLTADTELEVNKYGKTTLGQTLAGSGARTRKRKFTDRVSAGAEMDGESAPNWAETSDVDSLYEKKTAAEALAADAGEALDAYWHAYYRVAVRPKALVEQLEFASQSSKEVTKKIVRDVLFALERERLRSARYTGDAATGEACVDAGAERVRLPALLVANDALYFAVQLFSSKDPLGDALAHAQSAHVVEGVKYVRGVAHSDSTPQLAAVRRAQAGGAHRTTAFATRRTTHEKYGFFACARDASRPVTSGRQTLNAHYDELARRARADALYLDADDELMHRVDAWAAAERAPAKEGDEYYGVLEHAYVLNGNLSYPDVHLGDK